MTPEKASARIIGLARDDMHRVAKQPCERIRLVAGLGVEGDAHAGLTMQHRSRWVKQRTVPNLRQVHLIQSELFEELATKGFAIAPAQMGENVTTRGIDLLGLSTGTRLHSAAIGLLASIGGADVPVFPWPRVAVIATGDELVPDRKSVV